MAVTVFCNDPAGLLKEIRGAIQAGTIETWALDSDGDMTHSAQQWKNLAWFRPRVVADKLEFSILGTRSHRMSKVTYGVYHGRLIEMLLSHFDTKFNNAVATAMPVRGDNVGKSS
jgi:hypothetical protein